MARVALLANFIPPYRVPVLEALGKRIGQLKVFVSTSVEPNREWPVEWGHLDVAVQRTVTFTKRWRKAGTFADRGYVHVPIDTIAQLWRFKPDVVIAGELGARSCLAALYTTVRPPTRLILWATVSQITERDRGRLRRFIRPALLARADAVFVNGASGARYINGLGVPSDRIHVAPYTIDTSAFAAHSCDVPHDDVRRLLYVGLLVERKGAAGMLAALAAWGARHPNRTVEMRIAGHGPERERLAALAMPPNVRIEFLGGVPYERLPDVYRECDILVMPTLEDEWGVVVNEAMASGRPVLGSLYSQAVEELVEDGRTGWTFRPDHMSEVQQAIDRALNTPPEELRQMGRAARERALQIMPATVADQVGEVVRRLIDG